MLQDVDKADQIGCTVAIRKRLSNKYEMKATMNPVPNKLEARLNVRYDLHSAT